MKNTTTLRIDVGSTSIGAILEVPSEPIAMMALAHGAGAGMDHVFMTRLSDALVEQSIGVMRFNFPYIEKGSKRPDSQKIAVATTKAALQRASEYAAQYRIPVLAAGKSFGGRMFSHTAFTDGLGSAIGLIFFGFPLHAPGKQTTDRALHLQDIGTPMLFFQGTRDTLAKLDLITQVTDQLMNATLVVMEGADHGFHMLKRSGVTDEEVIHRIAGETRRWLTEKLGC